ncbi:hypothetical protein [Comamonas sp. NLF-1-9]|uniref:hypothetical protein n=1 Tax=Comamonas sp. NLF-1-9 TaxID=2853163 RepID=UPI001C45A5F3|nr:hypothetical protein [Comamonas sp. NLF-1-9]QXL83271.1 hypothetical protein KUD94_08300 [Comamonas sp. NLF-1-9]
MTKRQTQAPANEPEAAGFEPLDLHEIYMAQAFGDFSAGVRLGAFDARRLAQRLRGIEAISAVLLACGDDNRLRISARMLSGLADAVHALALEAIDVLDRADLEGKLEAGGGED